MTDRELLELAAKAAGLQISYWTEDSSGEITVAVLDSGDFWQPLLLNTHTDCMGDALRLAVQLRMTIRLEDPAAVIAGWAENQHVPFTRDCKGPWFWKEWGRVLDAESATRRAIVRAAAEIGRQSGTDRATEAMTK